ncbi:hypothetical protein [uncultured Paludibaculum sp.]|uniref:hypothetical protein n=1 Tax=uncultured Paludibaculum sp. TaxID=1765020 RepID=UPI002AAAB8DD|nr:hypothetical protein [uncultured Paludibaculum sp.]
MPRPVLTAIRFRPAVAIARIGDSPSPLEAFTWGEDPRIFGAGKTVIVPRASFEVLPDGSLEPYMPGSIRFKDGRAVRPVCPFLELAAEVDRGFGRLSVEPLTGSLLNAAGISPAQVSFEVLAANRKAERRTGDPACRFESRLFVEGNHHERVALRAWSHVTSGEPLVLRERPVPLGYLQVIRPSLRISQVRDLCFDTLRVRFTPATGEVYGPPGAAESRTVGSRGAHVIVPPENRILNPAATWSRYDFHTAPAPRPGDTYDGESDLDQDALSWGVVDDTCDVRITVTVATPTQPLNAVARVFVGPPDFAPDRRPFYSIADDLADRDPASLQKRIRDATPREWHDAVTDLFRRISETTSLINVERQRFRHIDINRQREFSNPTGFPEIGEKTMTAADRIQCAPLLSDTALAAIRPAGANANDSPTLPRAEYAKIRHDQLAEPEILLRILLENRQRVREILRPPFARTSELPAGPRSLTPFTLRDPRVPRSYAYDMRMPPYLRDGDFAPLSLTRLQWELLFRDYTAGDETAEADFAEAVYRQLNASRRARKLRARRQPKAGA